MDTRVKRIAQYLPQFLDLVIRFLVVGGEVAPLPVLRSAKSPGPGNGIGNLGACIKFINNGINA